MLKWFKMANTEQKICSSKLQRLKPVGWGSSILGPHMKIRSLWNFMFGNQRFRQGQENLLSWSFRADSVGQWGVYMRFPQQGYWTYWTLPKWKDDVFCKLRTSCLTTSCWTCQKQPWVGSSAAWLIGDGSPWGPLVSHPKIDGIYGCSSPFNYGIS